MKIERHRIAVFLYNGRLTAISDICNHKGGPLSEGRVNGEFVTCPWHGWEYSVVTGRGPAGYDEDNIQSVAGGMMTFWSELGFLFPQFPFIAHSRGWDAEDMQNKRAAGEGQRSPTGSVSRASRAGCRFLEDYR